MNHEDDRLDGVLREAFGCSGPEESVLERLASLTGTRSRILVHEPMGDESPLLRVSAARSDQGAEDDSRYRIVGEIARGGVGVVYKARDLDLGRDVALKILRKEHALRPEVLDRLVEEAQIGGQLQHPGIVPIYGMGLQPDGRPYFAMKLIKGRTLAALLRDRPDPSRELPRFIRIFQQVCQAMAYAHSRGVIHRDLKPSNVMLGGFGEVQVVDWGFGKVLGRADPLAPTEQTVVRTLRSRGEGSESLTGSVMGTPAYMPPEQALGQVEELDERSDVFALGAILCEILTGSPPYVCEPRDLLTMAAQARLEEAHGRLDACRAEAPLVTLCRRSLAPLRRDRPADGSELARTIEEHLAAADDRAREAELRAVRERGQAQRQRAEALWARGSKRRTMALAALTILAVTAGGTAWLLGDAERRARAVEKESNVRLAMDEAARLLGAERWVEAASEARVARDLAAQTALLAPLRDEAESLALRIEASAARVRRRDDLLGALETIAMLTYPAPIDARYRQAFREAGLEPGEGLADAVRREYPEAVGAIAAALDRWAALRRRKGNWDLVAAARSIDPDPWRDRLREAAAAGDVERLRELADEADLSRGSPATLCVLGEALREAGDHEAAAALYRRLVAASPGEPSFHSGLDLSSPEPSERLVAASANVALRPDSVTGRFNLGGALWLCGDLEGALTAFREGIRLKPDDAPSHLYLGRVLSRMGDRTSAVAAMREAIALGLDEKQASVAHFEIGHTLSEMGDAEGAATSYRESIRLDPEIAEAHCNLGLWLSRTGRFREGLELVRKGHELGSRRAGWSYPSQEWVERAERRVEVETRIVAGEEPKDPVEALEFARVCTFMARPVEALRFYAHAFTGDAAAGPWDRYNAACCAVLAGGAERRAQALEWLRADLPASEERFAHWLKDPELAAVRDRIEELPEGERGAWRELWAEVRARGK